jgi:undecaprenyl-diphosphatase
LLLVALLSWFWQNSSLLWAVVITTLIVFTTLLTVTLVKFFVRRQRPRPPGEFVVFQYDAYSFPSGHSARMAALSASTIFFYPPVGWFLLIITLGVAIARIIVGIHYLSDVLVGLGLGITVAWIGITLSWPIN